VIPAGRRALVLAGLQVLDLAVTQTSSRFGEAHLDHLGVPAVLRPALPVIKATSTVALAATSRRPLARSVVGAGLVAYYASAATFHILAGDRPADAAPATLLALLAASLV
jgi:hypothetical protein